MPLPQFLLMLVAVIIAAAVTVWVALSAGVPPLALGLIALIAVAALHLALRDKGDGGHAKHAHRKHQHGKHH